MRNVTSIRLRGWIPKVKVGMKPGKKCYQKGVCEGEEGWV